MILSRLHQPGGRARLAVVLGVPLLLAVAFVATAGWLSPGWLSPGRLTPGTFIAALHGADGVHPGFRSNHAKGMCVIGSFTATGAGSRLSMTSLLASGTRSEVIGRVSLAGGQPFQPDAPGKVRALGLRLIGPDHAEWRTAMIDLPVFPARDPAAFAGLLVATRPDPATRKPDPARMKPFLVANPETAAALKLISARTPTAGFADDTYRSLDSFLATDAAGRTTPIRWMFTPEQPVGAATAAPQDPDYLFEDLARRLAAGPLRWHLMLIAAAPGDPTADPTLSWPADRAQIDAGTLTLTAAGSEDSGGPGDGACTGINYDPTILPEGLATSDDPIPAARSSVYARSFTLREGQTKPPSAVTVQQVMQPQTGAGR